MSLLDTIRTGREQKPPRILMYGTEGIGKSTWAAGAPNPVYVPTEDGLSQIDCKSFPVATSLEQVLAALETLSTESHEFESVIIDTADWLERLIWDDLCVRYCVTSIEKVDGGYAR